MHELEPCVGEFVRVIMKRIQRKDSEADRLGIFALDGVEVGGEEGLATSSHVGDQQRRCVARPLVNGREGALLGTMSITGWSRPMVGCSVKNSKLEDTLKGGKMEFT